MSSRVRLFVALASTGVVAYIAVGSLLGRVLGDTTYGQLAVFNEVVRLVLDTYVEPVEGPSLDRAMAAANLGLTDALDGESGYLDAEAFKAFQQPPRDSDADVGVQLSRRFSFLLVMAVRPGSPAEKVALRVGDVIKTIDGRHTRSISAPLGERLLRGAPGSVVKVKILRDRNEPIEISLVRERLAPVPARGRIIEDGIGAVKVTEFSSKTAEEVRTELEGLRRSGARKLVLDLRGAAFGPPSEAVRVAELFMKGGVVAKVTGRRTGEQVLSADPARSAWDLPVAVLVDRSTAGPAEIVAAALLDAGLAPVVGESTQGRAPVLKTLPLHEGGLVLTVAKYVSPKGASIHGKGVEPSVAVARPEGDEEDEQAPPVDPILDKALEILKKEAQPKAA